MGDDAEKTLLDRLAAGRVDPRRGVGPVLGTLRVYVIPVYLAGFAVAMLVHNLTDWSAADLAMRAVAFSAVGMLGLCWLVPLGIRRRTRRRCLEHGYFLCPWCRYPLAGLSDAGRCPECGSGYAREVCERLYTQAYKPGHRSDPNSDRDDRTAWTAALRARLQPDAERSR